MSSTMKTIIITIVSFVLLASFIGIIVWATNKGTNKMENTLSSMLDSTIVKADGETISGTDLNAAIDEVKTTKEDIIIYVFTTGKNGSGKHLSKYEMGKAVDKASITDASTIVTGSTAADGDRKYKNSDAYIKPGARFSIEVVRDKNNEITYVLAKEK